MIIDGKKIVLSCCKNLPALLRGITSKYLRDFCSLNYFRSYRTENKLKKKKPKKVCENHDYCYVEMPREDNKILKYNQGDISMKVPFIIYADLESLLEKNEHLP